LQVQKKCTSFSCQSKDDGDKGNARTKLDFLLRFRIELQDDRGVKRIVTIFHVRYICFAAPNLRVKPIIIVLLLGGCKSGSPYSCRIGEASAF
jgi:hypothetical protein